MLNERKSLTINFSLNKARRPIKVDIKNIFKCKQILFDSFSHVN
jgi:hypothetical protein